MYIAIGDINRKTNQTTKPKQTERKSVSENFFLFDQNLKSLGEITDVDERFETLSKVIMDCLDRFSPKEEFSNMNKKESSRITNKVKNETVKRDQSFKIWILQTIDYNRERYVKQRNRVNKVIRNEIRMKNF